ncbi:hypothetical protein L1887_42474 [Cichorium endivia]|nr:hypothetical protein L1887_42474 [Cichorium endivia]
MTGQAAGGCCSSSPQARLQRAEKAQPGKYRRRCLPQPTPPLPTTHSQLAPLHHCLVSHRFVATPTSFRPLHRFCLVSSLLPLVHLVSPRLVTFATAPNSRRLSSSSYSASSSSSIRSRAPVCSASFGSHFERVNSSVPHRNSVRDGNLFLSHRCGATDRHSPRKVWISHRRFSVQHGHIESPSIAALHLQYSIPRVCLAQLSSPSVSR